MGREGVKREREERSDVRIILERRKDDSEIVMGVVGEDEGNEV